LKSGLAIDQIQEILVSFYEKADELIADIGNAYLGGDSINLNARAHELKGMAGNFGFSELSRMCGIIEKAAKDNQLDIAKDPIDHLGENYAIARSHLNKWLNQ
jgi:HPt (histidine-containing phosphotransfer) domain-containing protein